MLTTHTVSLHEKYQQVSGWDSLGGVALTHVFLLRCRNRQHARQHFGQWPGRNWRSVEDGPRKGHWQISHQP